MSKAFTKEPDNLDDLDDDELERSQPTSGGKNYITPLGFRRLQEELNDLVHRERPAVTEVVAWAASNGDRSENADYKVRKAEAT